MTSHCDYITNNRVIVSTSKPNGKPAQKRGCFQRHVSREQSPATDKDFSSSSLCDVVRSGFQSMPGRELLPLQHGRQAECDLYTHEGFGKQGAKRLVWMIAIFAVLIQQGAFLETSFILRGVSLIELRDIKNPFNTAGVGISMLAIGLACLPLFREMRNLALNNKSSLVFMLLVLVSACWSVVPGLTIRRGLGYALTIAIAAYLTSRFDIIERMKVLSASFAVSAIGSLLFICILPNYGIMQEIDLAGTWRGVFSHKNVLGPTMAIAVFTELFILVACSGKPRWRFGLLCIYLSLVVFSHSSTALLLCTAFFAGTCIYLLWQRDKMSGLGLSILCILLLIAGFIVFLSNPDFALGILGKDTSLTGRTALWSAVIPLIEQKPLLGWGYRAFWQMPNATLLIDQISGWGATSSHNAFLEIALQLGLVGLGLLLLVVMVSLGRALRCCRIGVLPLGWFSVMFIVGTVVAGMAMETLGRNQSIEWLMFNILAFSCGKCLSPQIGGRPAHCARDTLGPQQICLAERSSIRPV